MGVGLSRETCTKVHTDGLTLTHASSRLAAAGPQRDEPPEEGTIHRATVKRIEAYGVFVQLDGFRKHGLVHSSQVCVTVLGNTCVQPCPLILIVLGRQLPEHDS